MYIKCRVVCVDVYVCVRVCGRDSGDLRDHEFGELCGKLKSRRKRTARCIFFLVCVVCQTKKKNKKPPEFQLVKCSLSWIRISSSHQRHCVCVRGIKVKIRQCSIRHSLRKSRKRPRPFRGLGICIRQRAMSGQPEMCCRPRPRGENRFGDSSHTN